MQLRMVWDDVRQHVLPKRHTLHIWARELGLPLIESS